MKTFVEGAFSMNIESYWIRIILAIIFSGNDLDTREKHRREVEGSTMVGSFHHRVGFKYFYFPSV